MRLDYIGITDAETLERLERLDDRPILIAVAAYVVKIRLIDNIMLNGSKKKDVSSAKA